MNIKLNRKRILDRCGTVSFKKGEAFFRAQKVFIEEFFHDHCKAVVNGSEKFEVAIAMDASGEMLCNCSCPKLVSYNRDCQHVAAVLLAMNEFSQLEENNQRGSDAKSNEMDDSLFSIFETQSIRKSSRLTHFEKRLSIAAEFLLTPIMKDGQWILGISMQLEQHKVANIRQFLEHVTNGKPYRLSDSFCFDPKAHCFQKETDEIIQQLVQLANDEKIMAGVATDEQSFMPIPPTAWNCLLPLLSKAPLVTIIEHDQSYTGLNVTNDLLPLQFDLSKTENLDYQLKVWGLNKLTVLKPYNMVLVDGSLYSLSKQDCTQVLALRKMFTEAQSNQISLSQEQIRHFLIQVVPVLRNIGKVTLAADIEKQFMKTPLIAKLYLDRVNNRLLAGLEFHYANLVINSLDSKNDQAKLLIVRDTQKEEKILQLMEESAFTKTDEGYYLHNEELEYEFLYHILPTLQKLVQVYATTAVRNRIFRGNARPQIRVKVKKERTNWLEFKFEMDGISNNQIQDVLSALEEKRKFFRLQNGSLLSLESREWKEIQHFLYSPQVQNQDISNGLELPIEQCLALLDSVDEHNLFQMEESFRQFLETIRNPGSLQFNVPGGLDSILRDYQKQGFQWMKTLAFYGFGGILADDMGLGKTLQSIAFIVSELEQIRERQLPALIVCPSSLTYNWLNEIMKFAPELETVVIDGPKRERTKLQKELANTDVVITSYPLLRKDIKWYEVENFYTIFFDEAQTFKNPVTQTARAVKKLQAKCRFALTGTPIENSLEELWSIFHVVFPELFLGLKEYSKLTRAQISRRIRPFLLRRMKESVLSELPKKIELTESAELLPEQKRLYAAYLAKLRHDTFKHLDKETIRKNRIKILAGLTRLRQICCHPSLFVDDYKGSSAKFEQLMDILEESRQSGRKVLLFSQFTKMLGLIGEELNKKGLPYFYLDGQTPPEQRVDICNRFNEGESNLFLISLKAGGTGLNLMGADTVILYDTWWNPAVEEQAADRAHRMGQKNSVQVIKLIARGTIEEKINELQEKKKNLIEEVISQEEPALSGLTEEDIAEILMV